MPQSLNRYAATSQGSVRVGEGVGNSGISPVLSTIGLIGVSAGGGAALTAYATGLFGQLHIQANSTLLKRAGYQSLFSKKR